MESRLSTDTSRMLSCFGTSASTLSVLKVKAVLELFIRDIHIKQPRHMHTLISTHMIAPHAALFKPPFKIRTSSACLALKQVVSKDDQRFTTYTQCSCVKVCCA